jgi:hypothetical protein
MALLYPYSLYPHCNIDTSSFSRVFFLFQISISAGWSLMGPDVASTQISATTIA